MAAVPISEALRNPQSAFVGSAFRVPRSCGPSPSSNPYSTLVPIPQKRNHGSQNRNSVPIGPSHVWCPPPHARAPAFPNAGMAQTRWVPTTMGLRPHSKGARGCHHTSMNILLLLVVLLLLFGGGGFYMGGPVYGGSGFGLILVIALIVYFMGGFRGSKR